MKSCLVKQDGRFVVDSERSELLLSAILSDANLLVHLLEQSESPAHHLEQSEPSLPTISSAFPVRYFWDT